MRKWLALLAVLATAGPAMAAKTMSIDQMERFLHELHGQPDGRVAGDLAPLQLTERVSAARLARWEAEFPGRRTHQQLIKLADLSAFLNPPASDLVSDRRPDIETERHILWLAVQYARTTISRLPDLYATRETTHFEDTLSQHATYSVQGNGGARHESEAFSAISLGSSGVATDTVTQALHEDGSYSRTVTYRGGHEVPFAGRQRQEPALGLTTSGEFGPILAQVLTDALENDIGFLRWEHDPGGTAAVFNYTVPAATSHFTVGITAGTQQQTIHPAYHGEIAIDAKTGEVLWLSELADMTPPHQDMRAAIEVEYAPVKIGERSYLCPVKGVAFSRIPVPSRSGFSGTASPAQIDASSPPVQTELNDVAFRGYHEFHADVRLVTNPGGNADTPAAPEMADTAPGPGPNPAATVGSTPAPESASEKAPPAPAPSSPGSPAPEPNRAAEPSSATAPPPSNPVTKTEAAASPTPPAPAPVENPVVPAPSSPDMTLRVTSRLVLLDVVVRKDTKPVAGLQQGDFAVYEDGVPQPIRYFTPHFADHASPAADHAPGSAPEQAPAPSLPPNTWTNLPIAHATGSVTVLLLDGLNTQPADVQYVRREMIRYLKTEPPDRRIAVFALGHELRMLEGFTTDTSQLLATLEKSSAASPSSLLPAEEDKVNEAEELANMADAGMPADDVGRANNWMGDEDAQQTGMRVHMTLDAMQELARYLDGISGRKNLVWFSGSFPLQFFSVSDTIFNGPNGGMVTPHVAPVVTFAQDVKQTADMLATARVAVYPVDVRGVLLEPMYAASKTTSPTTTLPGDFSATPAALGRGGPQGGNFGSGQQLATPQRATEHNTMDVLAQETGGRAVYDSNGLKKAMADALSDGENFYTIGYVPTNRNYNGAQRNIQVRLTARGKDELFYRRSYYADDAILFDDVAKQSNGNVFMESMRPGVPASSQIVFDVRAAAPDPGPPAGAVVGANASLKNRAARYAIDYAVSLDSIHLTQNAGGTRQGRLRVLAIAYDRDGKPRNWVANEVPIALDPAAWDRASRLGLQVHQVLDLPAGDIDLRVGLCDPASGRIGTLEIPLHLAPAK